MSTWLSMYLWHSGILLPIWSQLGQKEMTCRTGAWPCIQFDMQASAYASDHSSCICLMQYSRICPWLAPNRAELRTTIAACRIETGVLMRGCSCRPRFLLCATWSLLYKDKTTILLCISKEINVIDRFFCVQATHMSMVVVAVHVHLHETYHRMLCFRVLNCNLIQLGSLECCIPTLFI
jgi:hypothetical protein